jgi:hypothetical protein
MLSVCQIIVCEYGIISEQWIGKDLEGSRRGLIWSTIAEFLWRDWVKPRKTQLFYSVNEPTFGIGPPRMRISDAIDSIKTFRSIL